MMRNGVWCVGVLGAGLLACAGAGGGGTKAPQKPEVKEAQPPVRVRSFPEGQALAAPVLLKWQTEEDYAKFVFRRAYSEDSDWRTGNPINGVPRRLFNMALFVEVTKSQPEDKTHFAFEAGTCFAVECSLAQEAMGGGWSDPKLACSNPSPREPLTCASVQALPEGFEAAIAATADASPAEPPVAEEPPPSAEEAVEKKPKAKKKTKKK